MFAIFKAFQTLRSGRSDRTDPDPRRRNGMDLRRAKNPTRRRRMETNCFFCFSRLGSKDVPILFRQVVFTIVSWCMLNKLL